MNITKTPAVAEAAKPLALVAEHPAYKAPAKAAPKPPYKPEPLTALEHAELDEWINSRNQATAPAPKGDAKAPATPGTTVAKGVVLAAPPIPDKVDATLTRILSSKRKHSSPGELNFLTWLRQEIKDRGADPDTRAGGCIVVVIKDKQGKTPSTLFSCHVDTVHSEDAGVQTLAYDPTFGHIILGQVAGAVTMGAQTTKGVKAASFADKDGMVPSGSCLGADDGAGIWLMLEMIKAKVPGGYIFHRGEECGGVGANAMLDREATWLKQFDAAIAFDRPRTNEVIITQGGSDCASKTYGAALAEALNVSPYLDYEVSERGVFTDTKVYRRIIDECINIGVGYENQHTTREHQDYGHLVALRDRLLQIDWDKLPVTRDASKATDWGTTSRPYGSSGFGGFGSLGGGHQDDFHGSGWERHTKGTPALAPKAKEAAVVPVLDPLEEVRGMSRQELDQFVCEDAQWAADTIYQLAIKLAAVRGVLDFLGVDL